MVRLVSGEVRALKPAHLRPETRGAPTAKDPDGRSRAGEIDDPRLRENEQGPMRYRQGERLHWWYEPPPPSIGQDEAARAEWHRTTDHLPARTDVPAEMSRWLRELPGQWLIGEDDSPLRASIQVVQGAQPSLRAAFYRADRSGIRNEAMRTRIESGGLVLTCGDLALCNCVSTRLWLVWRLKNSAGAFQEQHWFRGEEAQMLAQWFGPRVSLSGNWVLVDLEGSLQARYDSEQGLGLLEECIRWRLLQAEGLGDVWARVNLTCTRLGDKGVEDVVASLCRGGARCVALTLRDCNLTAEGLQRLQALLEGQPKTLAEIDVRGNAGCCELWRAALCELLVASARPPSEDSWPLWLAVESEHEGSELCAQLRASLRGQALLSSRTSGGWRAVRASLDEPSKSEAD